MPSSAPESLWKISVFSSCLAFKCQFSFGSLSFSFAMFFLLMTPWFLSFGFTHLFFGNYISISKFPRDLVSYFQTSARHSHLNTLMVSHTHHTYNCSYPTKSVPAHEYLIVSKCSVKGHDTTASPLACYLFAIMWLPSWFRVLWPILWQIQKPPDRFSYLQALPAHYIPFLFFLSRRRDCQSLYTAHCTNPDPFIWNQVTLYSGPCLLLFNNI